MRDIALLLAGAGCDWLYTWASWRARYVAARRLAEAHRRSAEHWYRSYCDLRDRRLGRPGLVALKGERDR